MTNLAFPQVQTQLHEDEMLGQEITLLAGQINAANHRQLHRGGFSVSVNRNTVDSQLLFSTPSGGTIETRFFPQFSRVSAETSIEALSCMAPDVDAGTCVTQWQGEGCDYGMAVDGLLRRGSLVA